MTNRPDFRMARTHLRGRARISDYAVAFVSMGAAVLLRWLLDPWLGNYVPFITLFGAVALAVWYGGYRPAIAATVPGFLACKYLFVQPRGSILFEQPRDYIGLVLFLLTCAVIIAFGEGMRLARRRSEEGQERLRTTLASIGDAVIATDAEARITSMNTVAEQLTGWKSDEALGQPLEAVFRIVNELTRVPARNPVQGPANHALLIARDGTEHPIDNTTAPIRRKDGEIAGRVLVFRAIAIRRQAEAQLRESEERLRSVVNTVVDGIITIDQDATIQTFNPAAERLFGYDHSEVIGRNVKVLMPEPYRQGHDSYVDEYLRTGKARIIGIGREVTGRRKDGSTFPMDLAVSEFRLGERRYFTGIVRDITARKQAEEELRASDRRKDEFLAILAHELRNPLAPIRNAVQILQLKGSPDPELQWSCDVVDRQVRHMSRLLDDLLDVSRITHNKLELRKERVDLREVIQHAVETTRPLIDSSRQALTVTLPDRPVHLHADPVRLAQVFSNLLNNASKYSDAHGQIRLSCERHGDEAVVSVNDLGMGISEEMLPHIFNLFTQGTRVIERKQGGLGIGLALVQGLVELHGGRIDVRSQGRERGTEFTVRLPCIVDRAAETASRADDAEQASLETCRLLIVDDLKDSADSLAMLLTMKGHAVHTAYDGQEAIRAAERHRPRAVLLDIGMPDMNGYDVCRYIREQPWGKGMLIIALTGWGQQEDRFRTEEAGFDGHMVKPVDPADLLKTLAALASMRPLEESDSASP